MVLLELWGANIGTHLPSLRLDCKSNSGEVRPLRTTQFTYCYMTSFMPNYGPSPFTCNEPGLRSESLTKKSSSVMPTISHTSFQQRRREEIWSNKDLNQCILVGEQFIAPNPPTAPQVYQSPDWIRPGNLKALLCSRAFCRLSSQYD